MLIYEIKKNILSEQIKKNIIPLFIWPIIEIIHIIYNYNFSLGIHVTKIFSLSKNNLFIFVVSTYLLFSIFDKYVENSWRINFEKYQGVISQFFISPYPRYKWLLNRSIASFVSSSLPYSIIYIGFVCFTDGLDYTTKINLLFILILSIIISIFWGAFLISIFLLFRDGSPLLMIFTSLQYMVSGVQVPFKFMPKTISFMINIFPLSFLSSVTYNLLSTKLFLFKNMVIQSCIFSATLILITPITIKIVEKILKNTGNFDLF